ncbi:hypothetical protein JCM10908_005118 [Rhodotorula pacifica]|uniref:uncharacterized protein n=1 Tax=Rhodotorula pacifica TaxID=1495444 RepID=UPI00316CEDEE
MSSRVEPEASTSTLAAQTAAVIESEANAKQQGGEDESTPAVETPSRPKLPSLSSLALPDPLSPPSTPPLSSSSSSLAPSSSSSPDLPSCGTFARSRLIRPRPVRHSATQDIDKSHVQAAIYEALKRRWSTSSASELQVLADAAAEALRRKQTQRSVDLAEKGDVTSEEATPAWQALRAKRKSDVALEVPASSCSGMVAADSDEEESRDRVSPLPYPKRRRNSVSPKSLLSATRAFSAPCSPILHPSLSTKQQTRTLSLDAGTAAGLLRVPNRRTAFDNLLNSLAAVQTARSTLSTTFASPPMRLV